MSDSEGHSDAEPIQTGAEMLYNDLLYRCNRMVLEAGLSHFEIMGVLHELQNTYTEVGPTLELDDYDGGF